MSSYLDASVLVPVIVEEPTSASVRHYLREHGSSRLISDFATVEVASAMSRLVRMRQLSAADASSRMIDFDAWRAGYTAADLHPADVRAAYAYGQHTDLALRAPDALHLAMARRLEATLVTLDARLAKAARSLGIGVDVPGRDRPRDPE